MKNAQSVHPCTAPLASVPSAIVATLGAALLWSVLVPLAVADTEAAKPETPPPTVATNPPAPLPTAPAPALVTQLEGTTPVKAATLSSIKVYPSF